MTTDAAFYTDENVSFDLIDALDGLGQDILSARDDSRANKSIGDPAVLARATDLGRAVLTNNRKHYHRLHRPSSVHAGIVTYTEDLDIEALAARIHAAVAPLPALVGQLVKVIRPNPSARGLS